MWLVAHGGRVHARIVSRTALHPGQRHDFVIFFALSSFIVGSVLAVLADPGAHLLRLWAERRSGQTGVAIQNEDGVGRDGRFAPARRFLFFFSYALVNRTLNLWFPRIRSKWPTNRASRCSTNWLRHGHATRRNEARRRRAIASRRGRARFATPTADRRRRHPDVGRGRSASRDGTCSNRPSSVQCDASGKFGRPRNGSARRMRDALPNGDGSLAARRTVLSSRAKRSVQWAARSFVGADQFRLTFLQRYDRHRKANSHV